MRTDLISLPVSSRGVLITCQVNKMGCNVSKDGSEKNKKSQTNSTRHSAENNGDSKSQIISLGEDPPVPPVQNSDLIDSTKPIDTNSLEINQVGKEANPEETEQNETQTALTESPIQQSTTENMQASEKAEPPLDDEIDPDDPEMNHAAAKIQASFRGHKVRKEMMKKQDQQTPTNTVTKTEEEEEIDIDLDDPNVEKAATKIQASFRGHMVRKQVIPQKENPA